MSIDQLQTMQVIRGKRTMLGPEDAAHTGLFHAAPGRPRKVDKVSTMRPRRSFGVQPLTLSCYLYNAYLFPPTLIAGQLSNRSPSASIVKHMT